MRENSGRLLQLSYAAPGLIAACAGFFGLARRRRKETA
jgi:hypothetical protein